MPADVVFNDGVVILRVLQDIRFTVAGVDGRDLRADFGEIASIGQAGGENRQHRRPRVQRHERYAGGGAGRTSEKGDEHAFAGRDVLIDEEQEGLALPQQAQHRAHGVLLVEFADAQPVAGVGGEAFQKRTVELAGHERGRRREERQRGVAHFPVAEMRAEQKNALAAAAGLFVMLEALNRDPVADVVAVEIEELRELDEELCKARVRVLDDLQNFLQGFFGKRPAEIVDGDELVLMQKPVSQARKPARRRPLERQGKQAVDKNGDFNSSVQQYYPVLVFCAPADEDHFSPAGEFFHLSSCRDRSR